MALMKCHRIACDLKILRHSFTNTTSFTTHFVQKKTSCHEFSQEKRPVFHVHTTSFKQVLTAEQEYLTSGRLYISIFSADN